MEVTRKSECARSLSGIRAWLQGPSRVEAKGGGGVEGGSRLT